MHALVRRDVPFVLCGSIRDDGPLPEVITDAIVAQDAMRAHCKRATMAVMIASCETSSQARRGWSEPVDLLYVDGKHDFWSCRDDLRWSRFMSEGSTVLVHDGFSSLGVTAALLVELVLRPRFVLVDRAGSMPTAR